MERYWCIRVGLVVEGMRSFRIVVGACMEGCGDALYRGDYMRRVIRGFIVMRPSGARFSVENPCYASDRACRQITLYSRMI